MKQKSTAMPCFMRVKIQIIVKSRNNGLHNMSCPGFQYPWTDSTYTMGTLSELYTETETTDGVTINCGFCHIA